MRDAGHSVVVFFSDYHGDGLGQQTKEKLDEYRIIPNRMTYQVTNNPEDIDVMCIDENYEMDYEIIKGLNADILHSVQLNPLVELISRELNLPHIMNIYPFLDDFFKVHYSDIFPKYMTCDSNYWGDKWKQKINVDFVCIRTAVKHCEYAGRRINPNNIRCIMVGDIYKGKNQLNVIKGFREAVDSGFGGILELYGNNLSDYAKECKTYVIDNDMESRVIFHGFVSDIDNVYKNSDVLICGSIRESYPNVISEALSHGLLVVSTPVAGIPEVVVDGKNGLLTDGYEKEDFAKALIKAKEYVINGKVGKIALEAVETAKVIHSKEKVYEGLFALYNKATKESLCCDRRYLITDFRKEFFELINCYKKKETTFSDKELIRLKLWYLRYWKKAILDSLGKGKHFYLWGAGNNAKKVLEIISVFLPEVRLKAVIDSNKKGMFENYQIISPEEYWRDVEGAAILSLYNGQADVVDLFKGRGKQYGTDYFILGPREW